jgi:YD repeat-containing protein
MRTKPRTTGQAEGCQEARSRLVLLCAWCLAASTALSLALLAGNRLGISQAPGVTLAQRWDELDRRASRAMAEGEFGKAADVLREMLKLQPKSAETHANLGLAYHSSGRYEEAAASFRQALKLNPRVPHVTSFLGMAETESGRFQESLPLLEKSFAEETDLEIKRMVGIHLQKVHAALGDRLKAGEVTQQLLKLYPKDPEVLYIASRIFFQLSSEMVGRLVEVAPNSFRVRQLVGELLEANKQYGPAAEQFRKAIALEPNAPGLHYRLGLMLVRSSNDPAVWEEARQAFLEELRIDPTHARCCVELAEMHRKRGELDAAEELLRRGLSISCDLPEAHVGLGRIEYARGRPEAALEHLREAVRLAPESELAHFELFQVYNRLGRLDEAAQAKEVFDKLKRQRLRREENVLFRLDEAERAAHNAD